MARFGRKFDAQGVLAGTKDAARCVRYLTKYLTKQIAACHHTETDAQRTHAARLAEALRYEPCSPTCVNWLRYGIQPRHPRPENLGYAGRRVLVSRKWSGHTLDDHRADREAWLMGMLDLPAVESDGTYRWERVTPADADHMPPVQRLMHVLADRSAWQAALAVARRKSDAANEHPAVGGRAA